MTSWATWAGRWWRSRVGQLVLARSGHDVGGRPLQHGDVGGVAGHGRHQGHGGGPTADDDDPLALPVQVLGPVLGVDDGPAEARLARELGPVALVVAVVAGVAPQEAAGHLLVLAGVGALDVDGPPGLAGRPRGGHDPSVEADLVLDPVGAGRRSDVLQDRRAVGDGLVAHPWLERVAEGEHVGVRPDAGVAEEVPRAADGAAGLEDGVGGAGTLRLEVAGAPDAGQPGPQDQYVHVFHAGSLGSPGAAAAAPPAVPATARGGPGGRPPRPGIGGRRPLWLQEWAG